MSLRLALAQLAVRVGDIDGNVDRILRAWHDAAQQGADLLVTPELAVTGYPPEDLLLDAGFVGANLDALRRLAAEGPAGCVAVVGYVGTARADLVTDAGQRPDDFEVASAGQGLTNSAAVLADGEVVANYDKLRLPNYGVFDEARYFTPRDQPLVVEVAGVPVGVAICEDVWLEDGPVHGAARAGARLLASLNASPYHRGKRAEREDQTRRHVDRDRTWFAYVNAVGGQDEVVFDGDSFVLDPTGTAVARGAQFDAELVLVDLPLDGEDHQEGRVALPGADDREHRPGLPVRDEPARLDPVGEVWQGLVVATRDYCRRNGFERALIGLSGGIDSAVTAAIAADALGAEQVTGVLMPSPYSSDHSVDDARELAEAYGMPTRTLSITGPLEATGEALGDLVVTRFDRDDGLEPGVAYENLQSRLRGLLLMALSNEHGAIVLTTGNKSEYAVGYATLYGDMSGGFAPLKDVPKLLVYELARWRNAEEGRALIPTSTIDKAPSAELRPDQRDDDSLPPYEILDDIVEAIVEERASIREVVARGHDEDVVRRIAHLMDRAEFKRRQSAPGPKITRRAFGRERRVPITSGWRR